MQVLALGLPEAEIVETDFHEGSQAEVKSYVSLMNLSRYEEMLRRIFYYGVNVSRDLAPQSIFRNALPELIKDIGHYDRSELASRLNYYNKLPPDAPIARLTHRAGRIAMKQSRYYYDLKEHLRYFGRDLRVNYLFGDVVHIPEQPTLLKSRPIAGCNENSVLMKLDKFRHFRLPGDGLAFAHKKPMAVWRGSVNNPAREVMIQRFLDDPLCDVGFASRGARDAFSKPYLSIEAQLQYRYLVSIEGVDVATNLKWIMASNSLCLMAKPKYETWFMEGRLEAGRHYALLRPDYSDLADKVRYYETHRDEALEIIRNAHAHVAQFRDERRERLLSLLVLYKYFANSKQLDPDPRLIPLLALP